MKRIVNEYTETIHRPPAEPRRNRTSCGALRHVPEQHVVIVDENDDSLAGASRCGRCFENAGGY